MGRSSKWFPSSVTSSQASNASIVLSIWTAFRVTMNDGGCGVRARKSAMGVLGGASSLVCRHSSVSGVRSISGVWNWKKFSKRTLE